MSETEENTATFTSTSTLKSMLVYNKVWGLFSCENVSYNCYEILFYIVASLTFLILVFFDF